MRLDVEPWAITVLLEHGAGSGTGIDWSAQTRAAWVNWLVQTEGIEGDIPPQSKLGQARDFWRQRYQQKADESRAQHSRTAYRFVMERALVVLWRQPEQAAHDLYELYTTDPIVLGADIERRLASVVPRWDGAAIRSGSDHAILLPWDWQSLSAKALACCIAWASPSAD